MKRQKEECATCYETFALHNCPKCHTPACNKCLAKWILSTQDPSCTHCDFLMGRELLFDQLGKAWIMGPYQEHQKSLMLKREQAQFPELARRLDLTRRIREQTKESSERLLHEVNLAERVYMDQTHEREVNGNLSKTHVSLSVYISSAERIKRDGLYNFMEQRNRIMDYAYGLRETVGGLRFLDKVESFPRFLNPTFIFEGEPELPTTKDIMFKCPLPDCRGFVLNGKCTVCLSNICQECVKPLEEGHKCDPQDVKSIQLIKKDSVSCPNCRTLIFKTQGCDQMFCTSCHVAFNYKTLKINTSGNIHNPHYFEFLAENRITPIRDGDCATQLAQKLQVKLNGSSHFNNITCSLRYARHVQDYQAPQPRQRLKQELNRKLMQGKIQQKKYKQQMWQIEKANLRDLDEYHVARSHGQLILDILNTLAETPMTPETCLTLLGGARREVEKSLTKVAQLYDSKSPKLLQKITGYNGYI